MSLSSSPHTQPLFWRYRIARLRGESPSVILAPWYVWSAIKPGRKHFDWEHGGKKDFWSIIFLCHVHHQQCKLKPEPFRGAFLRSRRRVFPEEFSSCLRSAVLPEKARVHFLCSTDCCRGTPPCSTNGPQDRGRDLSFSLGFPKCRNMEILLSPMEMGQACFFPCFESWSPVCSYNPPLKLLIYPHLGEQSLLYQCNSMQAWQHYS